MQRPLRATQADAERRTSAWPVKPRVQVKCSKPRLRTEDGGTSHAAALRTCLAYSARRERLRATAPTAADETRAGHSADSS